MVVCSFVLGYVAIRDLAAEIARISRNGADLYLSEFHPDGYGLGWKRSFRLEGKTIELPTRRRSPEETERTFRAHGFRLIRMIQPAFGESERNIFAADGKSEVFESSRTTRAIFVCHLRRNYDAD